MAKQNPSEAEIQADAQHGLDAREDEAAEAEAQQDEGLTAAEKREADKLRVATRRKGIDHEAGEYPSTVERGGDTAYPQERLIEDAEALLGHAPHVVAGALHDNPKAYLSLKEAEKLVSDFLEREV